MAKAQKGDLIRITKVPKGWRGCSVGDIFEVTNRFEAGIGSHENGGVEFVHSDMPVGTVGCYVYDDQYEIRRKAGEESERDVVNSPNHYTQGRFETIEIIEEITQGYSDGYVAYCVGNALKYLARAPFKHDSIEQDLAKAGAYINFALERVRERS